MEKWCNTEGLSVNPQKTTMIAFTNKKTLVVDNIRFFNRILSCSENVKYLGVFFDSKMNWKTHFDYCLNKAKKFFGRVGVQLEGPGVLVLRSFSGFTG